MFEGKRIGAVLLMGGEGRRFGSDTPKQFLKLGGKEIYRHTLDALKAVGIFDEVVLVCHPDWMERVAGKVVKGGRTRQESSYCGLRGFEVRPDIVLIHDAVRPFVTEAILRANVAAALEHGAVDTCIPTADTLVHAPGGVKIGAIPRREEFLRGQTPQTFRYDWILKAHEEAGDEAATDDCQLVLRMGLPVHVVKGDEKNMKITSEFDLLIAEQLLCN